VLRRCRWGTAAGVLFAPTLPGLAVLVVVVAALEHAWSRQGVPGPPPNRRIDLPSLAYLGPR